MLVPIGLCMIALRQAWWKWSSPDAGRTGSTAIRVLLAAIALFGAVEIARGAETSSQAANIAS